MNLSGKGSYSKNHFANSGAVWNARLTTPHNPSTATSTPAAIRCSFTDGTPLTGGFHQVIDKNGYPGQGAIANPLGNA